MTVKAVIAQEPGEPEDPGARTGPLGERAAEAHVARSGFALGAPALTGVELEWLVREARDGHYGRDAPGSRDARDARDASAPGRAVPAGSVDAALASLGPLPGGGRLTREPGGQVELSSLPAPSLARCVAAATADLAAIRAALAAVGLVLAGYGLDPYRAPPPVAGQPRYRAMAAHFDRFSPGGRAVMCATASVQVCLDAGDDTDGPAGYRFRWLLAHRLGPVLIAAFANSPLWHGRPTGWVSTRQALWARVDPGRTRPPEGHGPLQPVDDPRDAWARYALDAPLLCVRRPAPAAWTAPAGWTFRSWLRDAAGDAPRERPPGPDDLDYHLGTLFPPVRPRGWLELRMIDAQPGDDGWIVPLAVAAALMDDPVAAGAAFDATEPLTGRGGPFPRPDLWLRAARAGPADPALGPAVRTCLAAAEAALARDPACAEVRRAVGDFADRYAARGRCPADDLLDRFPQGVRR
ncbi:ergothioneine biosynthesis glutamate--cysteine ligase EgtA [Streptomyces sp. NBC_01803]|uniref:ergothioneine biosynthesis glutamate--cysteine ligase EgtA n=1 Tax=Streptomyces sp. NBC_01803 TaxID=2975946 RepID=UPI002DD8D648|nr:ergothioneine biosynthesis glutamate--cysteine ligase EgtA [Streptomyces sp. NBC_01803]WSA44672.1 ergothioneine biosynthesis glutamate--cysteine ligase EgtA [Streptomyces sp. NBC_01803]